MQQQIDIFVASLTSFWTQLAGFIPQLLAALVLLFVGWILSNIARSATSKVLDTLKFDELGKKTGIEAFMRQGNINLTLTRLIANLVYWIILLVVIVTVANSLGLTTVAEACRVLEQKHKTLVERPPMPTCMYALFFLCLFVTVYDFRYRRVPNEITLPLMVIGIVASFPGSPALWMGSILILTAWGSGWMGAGDVKLWVGLLWCTFSLLGDSVTLVMFIILIVTGIVQILARVLMQKREIVGIKLPGAWRALVYVLFLVIYSTGGLNHVRF